jgi:uncharacterized membrane protein YfcA
MSPEPVSHDTFRWIVTVLTVAAALWALYDIVKMSKIRGKDRSDPLVRDERFGYWIGIIIGAFTISGMLRYHGVM